MTCYLIYLSLIAIIIIFLIVAYSIYRRNYCKKYHQKYYQTKDTYFDGNKRVTRYDCTKCGRVVEKK